jgi:hypothetical protein
MRIQFSETNLIKCQHMELNILLDSIFLLPIPDQIYSAQSPSVDDGPAIDQLFEYPKKSYLSSSYCKKYLPYFIDYFEYQTVLALRGIWQKSPQSHVLHGIRDIGRAGECCGLHDGVG